MVLSLYWGDDELLRIKKTGNIYISTAYAENIIRAHKKGLPMGLLAGIPIVSAELPGLIINRIPLNYRTDDVKLTEFVKNTECRYVTDKFSVKITE